MFCKINFFYNDGDWSNVLYHLKKIDQNFRVITNNFLINEYLKEHGITSNSFEELIPQNSLEYYKITKNSYEIMKKSTDISNHIFQDYDIITSIENQILKEIHLHEITKKCLEIKENIVFIFQGYQFSYFWILNTAKSLGFDCEEIIHKIEKNNFAEFSIRKKPEQLSILKKFQNLQNKLNLLSINKKNHTKSTSENNSKKKNSPNYNNKFNLTFFLTHIIKLKLLPFLHKKYTKKILDQIDKKLNYPSDEFKDFFFLYSWRDDLLSSTYPVINYFKKQKIPFRSIVFDIMTASFLQKNKIDFLNFFEETIFLSEILKSNKKFKKFINNIGIEFSKSNLPLFKNKLFLEYIFNELVTSLAIITICDYIFSKYKTNSVIVSEDGTRNINSILSVTNKQKISSYYIPSVIIKPHWPRYKSEKICIYGNQGVNELHSAGYSDNRILLTGNPRYDQYKEIKIDEQRQLLEQNFQINKNKKLIVIAMNRWKCGDEVWMSKLIQFSNKNNFEIVIKVHPTYKRWMNSFSESMIKKIYDHCNKNKFLISYELDIDLLIASADLVISDYSNVGIQAILLEKPLLTVNFSGEKWNDVIRFDKLGASIYFENYEKFEKTILEILNQNKHIDDFKIGRQKIINDYNFNNDGLATKRVFDFLRKNP